MLLATERPQAKPATMSDFSSQIVSGAALRQANLKGAEPKKLDLVDVW